MKKEYSKISPLDFAVSVGIVFALIVFLISMLSIMGYMGSFPVTILIFKDLYGSMGYGPTPLGAILGAVYAFIDAFILSFLFAWIYNKLLRTRLSSKLD
jgi:flagellar biosynthesis protein FliP